MIQGKMEELDDLSRSFGGYKKGAVLSSQKEEELEYYKKSLLELENLKSIYEKEYFKYKKEIDKIKDPFEEKDIVAHYHLREIDIADNDEIYYDTDRIDKNEFNKGQDVKIFKKELPKEAKEGMTVVLVRNPENGKLSYQLTHTDDFDFIDYAIEETNNCIKRLEGAV